MSYRCVGTRLIAFHLMNILWNCFVEILTTLWRERRLENLYWQWQGKRSTAEYAFEFHMLAAGSGWNKLPLKTVFLQGLVIKCSWTPLKIWPSTSIICWKATSPDVKQSTRCPPLTLVHPCSSDEQSSAPQNVRNTERKNYVSTVALLTTWKCISSFFSTRNSDCFFTHNFWDIVPP